MYLATKQVATLLVWLSMALALPANGYACSQQGMNYSISEVNKAYAYLSSLWFYYDSKGNKVEIQQLSKSSCDDFGKLVADGDTLELSELYNQGGQAIIHMENIDQATLIQANNKADTEELASRITAAHNRMRQQEQHGLNNLVWNENIARYAQAWANTLQQSDCDMQHRHGNDKIKPYGENLAWASGEHLSPETVVSLWYEEKKDYDYRTNRCNGMCGHYTQIVWATSRESGCGVAVCDDSEVWVCNYYPTGNWIGKRPY